MKKHFLAIFALTAFVVIVSTQSCYYDVESELYPNSGTTTACDTATAKFAVFVSPLLTSKCATSGCHSAASSSAGINLEGHTAMKNYISRNQSAFFGSINHSSGFSAMPKGGSKFSTCDISKLQIWVNAGMLNN